MVIRRSAITRKVRVKPRRTGKPRRSTRVYNPAFLAFVRTLPCLICYREVYQFLGFDLAHFGESGWYYGLQKSPTEAAHIGLSTSKRGLSQKFPDDECGPLCADEHHKTGPHSIHVLGAEKFFAHHGMDRDATVLMVQKLYAESLQ